MAATQTFFVERIETPTGCMRIVYDDTHHLRAVDWDDYEPRMRDPLRRYYGPGAVELREVARRSAVVRALPRISTRSRRYQEPAYRDRGHRVPTRGLVGVADDSRRPTRSYGGLAAGLAGRGRWAVGPANGANPIAIVVPCHRVIGADASLTGYGGGLNRKRWLLAHERGERPLFEQPAAEIAR